MTIHRFISHPVSSGRKGRRGKLKKSRAGARNVGATGQGSVRRPY